MRFSWRDSRPKAPRAPFALNIPNTRTVGDASAPRESPFGPSPRARYAAKHQHNLTRSLSLSLALGKPSPYINERALARERTCSLSPRTSCVCPTADTRTHRRRYLPFHNWVRHTRAKHSHHQQSRLLRRRRLLRGRFARADLLRSVGVVRLRFFFCFWLTKRGLGRGSGAWKGGAMCWWSSRSVGWRSFWGKNLVDWNMG